MNADKGSDQETAHRQPSTEYFHLAAGEEDDADAGAGCAPLVTGFDSGDGDLLSPAAPPLHGRRSHWLPWTIAVAALAVCCGLYRVTRHEMEVLREQLTALERLGAIQVSATAAPVSAASPATRAPPAEIAPPTEAQVSPAVANAEVVVGSDFLCDPPPCEGWVEVKAEAERRLGSWHAGAVELPGEGLMDLLTRAVDSLQARSMNAHTDECALGRVCMSFLALLTGGAGPSLYNVPTLHRPLLMVMLEVPWGVLVRSRWPLFALLAQLHMRTHGVDDLPVSSNPQQAAWHSTLSAALAAEKPAELAQAGAAYLERGGRSSSDSPELTDIHAMPILCALASQLLGDDLRKDADVDEALRYVQNFFKGSVQSVDDLHASIVSAWPLYGVLHAAASRVLSVRG